MYESVWYVMMVMSVDEMSDDEYWSRVLRDEMSDEEWDMRWASASIRDWTQFLVLSVEGLYIDKGFEFER